MNRICAVTAAIALLCLSVVAQAITIDTVAVGNAGNAADTLTGYGSVGYNYNIGKHEVTAAQYTVFLNAVATPTNTGSTTSTWTRRSSTPAAATSSALAQAGTTATALHPTGRTGL